MEETLTSADPSLAQLTGSLSGYLDARWEREKLSVKDALWQFVGWASAVLVLSGVLLTSVVFAFYGASTGLGEWMGNRPWLGYLCTGFFFLIFTALFIKFQRVGWSKKIARQKADLAQASQDAAHQLSGLLDPREWTKKHPIPSAGVAAFAGFVAATQMGGETIQKEDANAEAPNEAPSSPSLINILIAAGVEILKNTLTPVLVEALSEQLRKEPAEGAEGPAS